MPNGHSPSRCLRQGPAGHGGISGPGFQTRKCDNGLICSRCGLTAKLRSGAVRRYWRKLKLRIWRWNDGDEEEEEGEDMAVVFSDEGE